MNEATIQEVLEEMLGRVKFMEHLEVETYSEPSKTLSIGFNNAVEKFVTLIKEYQSELDPVHEFFTAPEEVQRPVYERALQKAQEEQEKLLDQPSIS